MQKIRLGSVIEVVMGQAPPGKDCNKEGNGTPFVKAGEFGVERPVIREWTINPKKLGQKGDVFLCVVGATCGKINLGEDCAIGRSVAALRPVKDKIDQRYLYYFMSGEVMKLRQASLGAAQTVISKEMINGTSLFLPPLADQQRIVEKLDAAFAEIDRAIEVNSQQLFGCLQLKDSLIEQLISSKKSNSEQHLLGELIESITTGPFGSALHKSDYVSSGVAVINPQNIIDGKIIPSDNKFITIEKAKELKAFILKSGDIVIGRRGEMGRCAIVPSDTSEYLCGTGCMIIRPKQNVRVEFLYELLSSKYARIALTKGAIGATMLNLNQKILKDITLNIVSLKEQDAAIFKLKEYRSQVRLFSDIRTEKDELLSYLKTAILTQELRSEVA